MKYMQTGGFQSHPLMKLTLNLTLLFLVGFWLTNWMMFGSKLGFSPASVAAHYLGSDADFMLPRTFQSMLEVTHGHLAVMAVVILLLTHLVIFAPFPGAAKVTLIVTAFLSAFVNEAAGWLIRYVSPSFSLLKLTCFFLFQVTLALLIAGLGWFLWTSKSSKRIKI